MATKESSKQSIFKRPSNSGDDNGSPRKGDLVGDLLVIRMRDYEPEFETKYGAQASALFDLFVVDGKHAGYKEADRREFGNLAQQIGDGLETGDIGCGRYVTGQGAQGRAWFGIEWVEDDEELARAEAAWLSSGEAGF